jgi:photosystem II stability/assembly factor-like uncharacterized protein
MKTRGFFSWLAAGVVVLSLAACNMPSVAPTVLPASPVPPMPALATPTAIVLPTAALGPAIQHFAAGQAFDVTYIRMVTATGGWAIGGLNQASDHVFRTQDGGRTWRDVTPPEPAPGADEKLAALGFFKDATHVWVVYGPAGWGSFPPYIFVWFTHDGGASWSYGAIDTSISVEAFSPWYLNFSDDQHGWLLVFLGAGMMHNYVALFATRDGGATWTDILDPFTDGGIQSFSKTGMIFVDAQTGWLTRDGHGVDQVPHIFRTSDGGVTWERIDLPTPVNEPALYDQWTCGTYSPNAFSAQSVILALKCLNTNDFKTEKDYLYSTNDGGTTWQMYLLPADYALGQGLLFFDAQNGLALGRKIYRTEDSGQTWSLLSVLDWDGQFNFVDPNLGWAVARNQGTGEIALVITRSGGERWDGKWDIIKPTVGP